MGIPLHDLRLLEIELLGLEHMRQRHLATPSPTACVPDPPRFDLEGRS